MDEQAQGATTTSTNPHGGAVSRVASLYQTGHGFLSRAHPRILWDGGEANDPEHPATDNAQGAGQGAGGEGEDRSQAKAQAGQQAKQPDQEPEQKVDAGKLLEQVRRMAEREGGAEQAALTLLSENRDYRHRIRELEASSSQQAQQLEAYRALGDDPQTLQQQLEQGRNALYMQEISEVAEVAGANARVLGRELKANGVTARIVDVPATNGQPARREVHVFEGDEDKGELKAYAEANMTDYLSALFPQGGPQRTGPKVVAQAGITTSATSNNLVQQRIAARQAQQEGKNT